MGLREFVQRRTEQMDQEDVTLLQKLMRRSFFHEFYEGYTEYMEPSNNRRGYVVKRVYTGKYYRADLPGRRWAATRFAYCVLLIAALALLGVGAFQPAGCNYVWYVTLPQALSLACGVWALVAMGNNLAGGSSLKIRDYKKGVVALRRATLLGGLCLCLTALNSAIYLATHLAEYTRLSILCTLCFVAAAGATLVVYGVERSMNYLVSANKTEIGSDGVINAFEIGEL